MIYEDILIIAYQNILCQSIINTKWKVDAMEKEPLKLKRRGEDGNRIISVRIREDTLAELDRLAAELNYSRNELINIILSYGVKNLEIE